MKKIFIFCVFHLFLMQLSILAIDSNACKPIVVSLGTNCQVALMLQTFKLREAAYPFDWVITPSLDSIILCIQDRFEHWLDPLYLEYRNHIFNSFYQIAHYHDFPEYEDHRALENFFDYIPQAKEKYKNRIQRFLDLLETDKQVIFICTEVGSVESSYRFIHFIKNNYPNLNFLLVNVFQGKLLGERPLDGINWYLPNIRNFFAYNKPAWWALEEWHAIFKELGLISSDYSETNFNGALD